MRVLFIGDVGSVGGAAKALLELTAELQKLGVEPIVCTSVIDEFNQELDKRGIQNFADGHWGAMNPKSPYRWKRPLKYPYESMRYHLARQKALHIIEQNVDMATISLVHTNSARNDIGCLIHEKYGIPHVMHIREFGQEDFDCCIYKKNYYQYLNKNCNILLAISDAVRRSWVKKGISEDKCVVLYDGIDISNIEVKDPNTFSETGLKVVIAGGVCAPKGQHIAVEALNCLPGEVRKHVSLDIAGWFDDKYVESLRQKITEYGLEENIRFLGTRNDLYSILKEYDVGLMCSKSEGFGRVTAEYLFAGLGVIAADTGASPELVLHQKTGLIYHRDDAENLAECIMAYYSDRELLKRYATAAHQDAFRFSAVRNAEEVFRVYQNL